MQLRRATVWRAGWGVGDQAFSSLTNLALGVLVARTLDLAAFGAFSLAFAAYLVIVSVTRAYPMEPLAIRYASAQPTAFHRAASAATGTVVLVGTGFGILFVLVGVATTGSFSECLLALGLTLPGLLLQDAWRSTFFAAGQGRAAFLNDLIWACVQFPALFIVIRSGAVSAFWLVLVWGGSAGAAAVIGIIQSSVVPRPWLAADWWREHTDLGRRFIGEALVRVFSNQFRLYGVGLVAGLAAVGTLRAGQLLFGPVQVVYFGIGLIAVPEGARALAVSLERLRRATLVLSVGLAGLAAGWGALVLLSPTEVGTWLLQDAWGPAHSLALPNMFAWTALMVGYGPAVALRALAAARRSIQATVVTAVLILVLSVGGAVIGSAPGSAWGMAVAGVLSAVFYWYQYRVAEREHARDPGSTPDLIGDTGLK